MEGPVKNCLRRAALAALLTLGAASAAAAQITTVIASPKRPDTAAQQHAARVEQAAQDSIARVTLTGMTQWVDSAAAALSLRPDTGASSRTDSTAVASPAPPSTRTDSAAKDPSRDASAEMRDGARAPNTATSFPTIALAGVGMIVLGLVMRRRPREARARARP